MSLPPSSFRSAIALLTVASSRCRDVPDKKKIICVRTVATGNSQEKTKPKMCSKQMVSQSFPKEKYKVFKVEELQEWLNTIKQLGPIYKIYSPP